MTRSLFSICAPLLMAALFSAALGVAAPQDASAQPTVLVLCSANAANGGADMANVKWYLDASGLFAQVDVLDCHATTPTLAQLQAYDAILLWSIAVPADPVGIGDVVGQYVAAGGGVCECQFSNDPTNFGIKGAWNNLTCIDPAYDLYWANALLDLGTVYDAGHEIMQGITTLNGGWWRKDRTGVVNGATKIFDWEDGVVGLAVNENNPGRVVSVNMFAGSAPHAVAGFLGDPANGIDDPAWVPGTSQNDELISQALLWACNVSAALVFDTPAAGALADGYELDTYSDVTFVATGGTTPYTWTVSAGSIPAGLTLDSATGILSGTPAAASAGTYNFTIQVEDNAAVTETQDYSIVVYVLPTITAPAAGALANGSLGVPYGPVNFTGTGGKPAVGWSVTAGSLPSGLTLNPTTGVLNGTPGAAGVSNFTITFTDANGKTDSRAYSINVSATVAITAPTPGALPDGYLTQIYNQAFTAAGGTPPYVWDLFSGTLPAGLTLSTTGTISGTPTAAGTSNFQVRVTDQNGAGASDIAAYSITVYTLPSISSPAPGALPEATQNGPTAYATPTLTFAGANGKAPLAWSATGLPAGITLNSGTGVLSGTPTAAGNNNITVTLTDANGKTANGAYTLLVNAPITITTSSLPSGEADASYNVNIATTGGTQAFTFGMNSTPTIATLSINPTTGQITGTLPNGAGNYDVTITVTDLYGSTDSSGVLVLTVTSPTSGGLKSSCGCNGRATGTDESFNLWLALLLPLLLVLVRRRMTV